MFNYISKEGLDKLRDELTQRKERRHEIAKRLEEAKALGDLSENTEYMEAREEQAFNEGRIMELENLLRSAVLIKKNKNSGLVTVGSTIEVESLQGRQVFTIVGFRELDPVHGRISNESPLGRSFLNHYVGDIIEVETPKRRLKYKILKIE